MVNVNAQFPFNLHNQELGEHSSSRSSRNVSGGTYGSSRRASPSPRRSLPQSPSSTSIHRGDEDLATLPQNSNRPAPILNQGPDKAPEDVQDAVASKTGEHPVPESEFRAVAGLNNDTRPFAPESFDDEERTPRAYLQPSALEDRSFTAASADPVDRIVHSTAPCPEDFTIHDAGAVSRSWGTVSD
ncbi:hypothetical protein BU15DRAFT_73195 [Melanogaster broomeanus]|nr:hypothetical protein BU15DRAFT_73195 [Melanogaster broomeanus]